jgi:hypothetical protein
MLEDAQTFYSVDYLALTTSPPATDIQSGHHTTLSLSLSEKLCVVVRGLPPRAIRREMERSNKKTMEIFQYTPFHGRV